MIYQWCLCVLVIVATFVLSAFGVLMLAAMVKVLIDIIIRGGR